MNALNITRVCECSSGSLNWIILLLWLALPVMALVVGVSLTFSTSNFPHWTCATETSPKV